MSYTRSVRHGYAQLTGASIRNGLVFWAPLDGRGNTYAYDVLSGELLTRGSNTVVSDVPFTVRRAGWPGYVYQGNGNNATDLRRVDAYTTTGSTPITMAAWVDNSTNDTSTTSRHVLNFGNTPSSNNQRYSLYWNSGAGRFLQRSTVSNILEGTTQHLAGDATLLVGVSTSNGEIYLYVNGVLEAFNLGLGRKPGGGTRSVVIHNHQDLGNRGFLGQSWNHAIWFRALSEAEIRHLYQYPDILREPLTPRRLFFAGVAPPTELDAEPLQSGGRLGETKIIRHVATEQLQSGGRLSDSKLGRIIKHDPLQSGGRLGAAEIELPGQLGAEPLQSGGQLGAADILVQVVADAAPLQSGGRLGAAEIAFPGQLGAEPLQSGGRLGLATVLPPELAYTAETTRILAGRQNTQVLEGYTHTQITKDNRGRYTNE